MRDKHIHKRHRLLELLRLVVKRDQSPPIVHFAAVGGKGPSVPKLGLSIEQTELQEAAVCAHSVDQSGAHFKRCEDLLGGVDVVIGAPMAVCQNVTIKQLRMQRMKDTML